MKDTPKEDNLSTNLAIALSYDFPSMHVQTIALSFFLVLAHTVAGILCSIIAAVATIPSDVSLLSPSLLQLFSSLISSAVSCCHYCGFCYYCLNLHIVFTSRHSVSLGWCYMGYWQLGKYISLIDIMYVSRQTHSHKLSNLLYKTIAIILIFATRCS